MKECLPRGVQTAILLPSLLSQPSLITGSPGLLVDMISPSPLTAALGISVDTTSLSIDAAESASLAIDRPFFSWSGRQRIVRNRKHYPIDTGLRRGAVTTTGHDRDKQLECAVFLLLRRRFRRVDDWRGTGEIDFVVDHRGKPTPVQVSWDATNECARRAVDEFHVACPTAEEAVFVTAESFEAGVPELTPADDDGT